ncbi:hypothetical protein SI859A1_00667 [Aurantimonas manganoxydans SI85-9A1]|uniref:Uncharacterized protein n=1 Tax=Aurantimonas manganoxydans (strain ATCC BAA-1229 / DSM 21871 / SI85-9A1) TaxID=287752 RepID=Q1YKH6_AURMS|nr:hypothetical protein SI859A1_00667 [Aurantimonas manganoxydans SI85-9A1]
MQERRLVGGPLHQTDRQAAGLAGADDRLDAACHTARDRRHGAGDEAAVAALAAGACVGRQKLVGQERRIGRQRREPHRDQRVVGQTRAKPDHLALVTGVDDRRVTAAARRANELLDDQRIVGPLHRHLGGQTGLCPGGQIAVPRRVDDDDRNLRGRSDARERHGQGGRTGGLQGADGNDRDHGKAS